MTTAIYLEVLLLLQVYTGITVIRLIKLIIILNSTK